MHQLSVTSDTDSILNCVKHSGKIKTEKNKSGLCFSSESKNELELFKQNLVNAITSVIKTKYRQEIAADILNCDYPFLTTRDKREVLSCIKNSPDRCSDMVFSEVSDFLSQSDTISVEGFVKFRLPEYKKEVRRGVDRAVRVLLAEQEYNDFIELLKYFVSCQPPKENHLHIAVSEGGGFSIYNGALRDITCDCSKLIAGSFAGDELSFDDILLSALITLAPLKITFHNAAFIKTPNLIKTVEEIFKGRVECCGGCDLCGKKYNF